MNIRRILSYIAVAVLAAIIWNTWVKEQPEKPASAAATSSTTATRASSGTSFAPSAFNPNQKPEKKSQKTTEKNLPPGVVSGVNGSTNLINVTTDVLQVGINPKGGILSSVKLTKYPVSIKEKNTPIAIISDQPQHYYVAQSGLTNTGKAGKSEVINYKSSQPSYTLSKDANQLAVSLSGKTANGLIVTKSYVFTKGSYAIKLNYTIKNSSGKTWNGNLYTQLMRKQPEKHGHLFYSRSYNGAAVSSPETPYEKITYKDMNKANIDRKNIGGWVAMQQHYFLSAWIPENQTNMNYFYSNVDKTGHGNIYTIGFVNQGLSINGGATAATNATLYVGPELAKNLKPLAPGLDRTIDFGWLWWVSTIIFWIMSLVHYVLGNWGWAIVFTTIIIKFILYPLTATSFRSMARMRELQPKMQRLKEQYGDDRQAMSRATMELYKKEKINPVGGCLPMLIQIPVFIGLYYVIIESVQLRQAPFIFWIHDLSVKDPYYVLPILMGLSMLLQQRLTPASPDPMQAKIMMFIPVVFTFFFINFPAGLTLYWLVNNCVQIGQQWYVNKTMDAHMAKKKAKKKKKSKFSNFLKK